MLTAQGWVVAVLSMVLLVCGRLFGIFELYVLGAGAATLVIAAVVIVARARLRLEIDRELHPPRLHAGGPSRVELRITNTGRRRTPLLSLRDPVGTGRSASVVVAPLAPGESVQATYRLPTERRGIVPIGPLSVEVADPFGLAASSTAGAPLTELTIWPAIDDVAPLPHTVGDDPHGGTDHPNALSMSGDDFYALRPYVMGDDLRHVHWRSTARRDELMVRQDEMPWQGRATVLLDTRADAHTPETFERAVSAAASVVVACSRRRFLIRLLTTSGADSGMGSGAAHVDGILEILAVVEPEAGGSLTRCAAMLRRPSSSGGALTVLLGGEAAAGDALPRLRRTFNHATAVVFAAGRGAAPSRGVVVVDDERPFAEVWQAAVRPRAGARR